MTGSAGERERGFALISVLWAAMILAVIVGTIVALGRSEVEIAHDRIRHAQLAEVAEAALAITILRLLDPAPAHQPPADAVPFIVNFAGHAVRVAVQDEAGKIDLNFAQPEVLRRLLTSAGVDVEIAQGLVDKILDWREPGNLKRLNGAKAQDYERAGYPYGPRGGPFESVAELQLVMGMTPQIFALIAPALTVYSQSPWIDPELAPPPVLLALFGTAAASAEEAARPRPSSAIRLGHAFTITAETKDAGNMRAFKTAVVRLTGSRAQPYWVYRWD